MHFYLIGELFYYFKYLCCCSRIFKYLIALTALLYISFDFFYNNILFIFTLLWYSKENLHVTFFVVSTLINVISKIILEVCSSRRYFVQLKFYLFIFFVNLFCIRKISWTSILKYRDIIDLIFNKHKKVLFFFVIQFSFNVYFKNQNYSSHRHQ